MTILADKTRGFTLVELITAASLMTVMMLGVVEIFGIVTETAAEAEAQNFANQQLRTFFDVLNRDIHGMAHQGYLKIGPCAVTQAPTGAITSNPTSPDTNSYGFYTLAFVSLGQWKKSMNSGTGDSPLANPTTGAYLTDALAAEVVYTSNVWTPTALLTINGAQTDVRRGILGRGVWIMNNSTNRASGGDPQTIDYSANFGSIPYFTGMLLDTSVANRRIDKGAGWATVNVWPALRANKFTSTNSGSLSRVMSSCVSEFLVERWDDAATPPVWTKDAFTFDPHSAAPSRGPRGLRVTAAVHNPDVLETRPASGRCQGYAMQEVYWISDP
jgi:type II secretory pathway pseudopilin PulG